MSNVEVESGKVVVCIAAACEQVSGLCAVQKVSKPFGNGETGKTFSAESHHIALQTEVNRTNFVFTRNCIKQIVFCITCSHAKLDGEGRFTVHDNGVLDKNVATDLIIMNAKLCKLFTDFKIAWEGADANDGANWVQRKGVAAIDDVHRFDFVSRKPAKG